MRVTIVGIGTREDELTLRGLRALREADAVLLRTDQTEAVRTLQREKIEYRALDALYEASEDFTSLCDGIARAVTGCGAQTVAYAVPGGAAMGDQTAIAVARACAEQGIDCAIEPGVGWEARAAADAGGVPDALAVAASDYEGLAPDPRRWLLVTEIDSRPLAGELKLKLLDCYPPAHRLLWRGSPIALADLDRQRTGYGSGGYIAVPPLALGQLERFDFMHLIEIMGMLRDPAGGCPWDGEQTHESLAPYVVEEAYEVVDAIASKEPMRLADELGDLLLQIAFHAQIADEHGEFAIGEVTTAICSKMISRHSHIFGEDRAQTAQEVLAIWERNKREEKRLRSAADALRDVPRALPAAMRAQKLLKRAAGAGIERTEQQALDDLLALAQQVSRGIGPFLFAAIDYARRHDEAVEQALDRQCADFVEKVTELEQRASGLNGLAHDLAPADIAKLFNALEHA